MRENRNADAAIRAPDVLVSPDLCASQFSHKKFSTLGLRNQK